MNFFEHQEQARQKTTLLVFLFIIAVLCLIGAANLILLVVMGIIPTQVSSLGVRLTGFSWPLFFTTSAIVLIGVGIAMGVKFRSLRLGGCVVAQSLGGRPILPNTTQSRERRVLNVVEEMALASGMPVPTVYLLSEEPGINAFAAGHTVSDAVIGVTKGCIEHLNREELQGVIAHEFSHIHNGDMRLNMQLLALLFGIVFIGQAGGMLLGTGPKALNFRTRRTDGRATMAILILGLGLTLVGWLGTFFGGIIKAAVSRQREFLADASAAQFTRNPRGLASALKRIGAANHEGRIKDSHAEELSHLFFANALSRFRKLRATHPPVVQRILRLEPDWDGQFPSTLDASNLHPSETKRDLASQASHFLSNGQACNAHTLETQVKPPVGDLAHINAEEQALFKKLNERAKEPFGAMVMCFTILLQVEQSVEQKQKDYLMQHAPEGTLEEIKILQPIVQRLGPKYRLPLMEMSVSSLRNLSEQQYRYFKQTLLVLVKADGKISLFEWCAFQLIRHYLDKSFGLRKTTAYKFKKPIEILDEFTIVLSLFVHEGPTEPERRKRVFGIGANVSGLYTARLLNPESITIEQFTKAVSRLAYCYPLLKERLLKGLIKSAKFNDQVSVFEKEIITSIAAVIDTPLPQDAFDGLTLLD